MVVLLVVPKNEKKGGSVGGRQLLAFTLLRPTHLKITEEYVEKDLSCSR